ncbi:helix-turn-helix domain-containing protein [Levilactobacillus lindianensis]|uniref:helix-turn-helix domain-containing protein n=1 Tax=Levilactobacillus lindianensis TaxID=2486018 RepID=UPI000F74AFFC|nr:helix-turn-helix domain-containing protein [Levilactobacillus lindianensis]
MTKHINLNDPEIMTAKDAALRWGKAPDYVRQVLRSNPSRFPEGTVKLFGRQLIVTREGMETVTGHEETKS